MSSDKREQIILAATKVFARDGLEKGRIDDIAEEAGIGKGTVYEYFRSKEDLFEAIVEGVVQQSLQIMDSAMAVEGTPRDRLEQFLHSMLDIMTQYDEEILLMTEIWAQGARGHWHGSGSSLTEMYHQLHEKVKTILAAGIAAGEFRTMNLDGVASLLLAFGDGLIWQYIMFPQKEHFKKMIDEAIKSFIRGIEK